MAVHRATWARNWLLESHEVSKRRPSAAKAKDRRPFAFEHRNQCCQSDVMYRPLVPGPGGKPRKTYLISLLDDAIRLIVHCQFCWSEKLTDFLPVFRQALLRGGVPEPAQSRLRGQRRG